MLYTSYWVRVNFLQTSQVVLHPKPGRWVYIRKIFAEFFLIYTFEWLVQGVHSFLLLLFEPVQKLTRNPF